MGEQSINLTEEHTTVIIDQEITTVTIEEITTVVQTQAEQGPPGISSDGLLSNWNQDLLAIYQISSN